MALSPRIPAWWAWPKAFCELKAFWRFGLLQLTFVTFCNLCIALQIAFTRLCFTHASRICKSVTDSRGATDQLSASHACPHMCCLLELLVSDTGLQHMVAHGYHLNLQKSLAVSHVSWLPQHKDCVKLKRSEMQNCVEADLKTPSKQA